MKTWNVYVQINAWEESIFMIQEVPVSDELYDQIQKAIQDNIPLKNCEFRQQLEDLAEKAAYDELIEDRYEVDKPDQDDYDDEEEFEAAMEEYEETLANVEDDYTIADITIDDPGDLQRLRDKFVGRTYPNCRCTDAESFTFEEEYEIIASYEVTVYFDEDGTVTDINDIEASAMESDGVRGGDYGECYPNYALIAEYLEDALDEFEGEDCEEYEEE